MNDLPDPVRRWTALARVVDPTVPSNRFALFVAGVGLLATVVLGLAGGTTVGATLGSGVRAGVGVFLGWAIARELDPDRTGTARLAGAGALVLLPFGLPDLAALAAVLLATRVVTRTTGLRPTVPDLVALVVLAWLAAGDPTGVVAAFGMAGALVWDTRLPVRAPRSSGLAGAIVLSTAVVAAVVGGDLLATWEAPRALEVVVFLAAMLAATQLQVTVVRSRADVTDEVLHPDRIRRARVLVGIVLAGTMVWVGGPGIAALGGAWAAFLAVGVAGFRARRLATAVTAVALLVGACSPAGPEPDAVPSPEAAPSPSVTPEPSPSPSASPTPPAAPAVREHDDPPDLATDLVAAERAIRDPDRTSEQVAGWAHVQQAAYRELAEKEGWTAQVRELVPPDLRRAFDLNARAQAQLHALTRPRDELPDSWTIVAPPPADELLAAYRTAAEEFGVDWTYLAAIHLIETRMGRIRGDSTAGARGPMQFLPATWEAYGEGDIEDPTDAIRAAARYLVAHGAPDRMHDALWAYNHSDRYVAAVDSYAQVMQAEPETYRAYHAWRVYYRLTSGSVVLEEGWSSSETAD